MVSLKGAKQIVDYEGGNDTVYGLDADDTVRIGEWIFESPEMIGNDLRLTVIEDYAGEDGGSLSQGQKQLLCITRLMLCKPPMLILDEATSSIDTRTEIKIQKAFKTLMQGRTTFIVAHRLATIKEADIILVMNNGSIVEQGSHNELLKKRGFYYDLYYSQFPK